MKLLPPPPSPLCTLHHFLCLPREWPNPWFNYPPIHNPSTLFHPSPASITPVLPFTTPLLKLVKPIFTLLPLLPRRPPPSSSQRRRAKRCKARAGIILLRRHRGIDTSEPSFKSPKSRRWVPLSSPTIHCSPLRWNPKQNRNKPDPPSSLQIKTQRTLQTVDRILKL